MPPDRLRQLALRLSYNRLLAYAWALGTGIIFVLSLFPHDLLLNGVVPDARLSGDVTAHVVGQRAFLQDSWHWPLLKTMLLDAPRGVSVAMTDSIPFVVLPLKLFAASLPVGFTAVHFWLAFCFLVQPIAAVFALRSAGETRLLPAIAVTLFAISMPTFIFRHPHTALCSHFLLLLALGSYFRTTRNLRGREWPVPPLLLASLLIHPYLAFMTLAILAAAPLTLVLRSDPRWRRSAIILGLSVALCGLAAACLGYAATNPTGGYGLDSMNALSPFYPSFSRFFGRGVVFLDPTGSQYEGYQYLGAGLLLLITVFFVTALLSTRTWFLRRHWGLALACLALTALALSNVIYVGTTKIVVLEDVPAFMHQLRSSGRLFWPVAYLLMIGGVAAVARLVPAPAGFAIVLSTGLLQFRDAHDMRKTMWRDLRAHAPMPIEAVRLDALMAAHRSLTMLPTFGCGASSRDPEFMQLLLVSSRHRVGANTMYLARFAALQDCDNTETAEKPLADGELRVFLPINAHTGPALVPNGAEYCRMLSIVAVCTLNAKTLDGLPPVVVPSVALGGDIPTGTAGTQPILGTGWYQPEPDGTWTVDGRASTVVASLTPSPPGNVELSAEMRGFTGVQGSFQQVEISVNGHQTGSWSVLNGERTTLHMTIPHDQLAVGPQIIRISPQHPRRPLEMHMGRDTRQLGIFLEKLRFDTSQR